MTSRTMPYLEGKPKEDKSMALKRLNQKVCMAMHRESCMHGEAVFAEPKFPTVESYARRSIPGAATSRKVQCRSDCAKPTDVAGVSGTLSAMSTR
jgi:hypothetical protein